MKKILLGILMFSLLTFSVNAVYADYLCYQFEWGTACLNKSGWSGIPSVANLTISFDGLNISFTELSNLVNTNINDILTLETNLDSNSSYIDELYLRQSSDNTSQGLLITQNINDINTIETNLISNSTYLNTLYLRQSSDNTSQSILIQENINDINSINTTSNIESLGFYTGPHTTDTNESARVNIILTNLCNGNETIQSFNNDGTQVCINVSTSSESSSTDLTNVAYINESNFFIPDQYFNGSVGIGTNSPSYKLDVLGNVSFNNTLYVINDGNVGIGTDSPASKLHIYEATDDTFITIQRGDGATAEFKAGSAYANFGTSSNHGIKMYTNGEANERIRINDNGNVAIGSLSPGEKLVIDGNVYLKNDDDKLLFGAGKDASIYYDGTDIILQSDEVGSGDFEFKSASPVFRIRDRTGTGDVATTQLQFLDDSSNILGKIGYTDTGNSNFEIKNIYEGDMEFYTNDTRAITIDYTQKVGIGTNNPETTLHVNGQTTFAVDSGNLYNYMKRAGVTEWRIADASGHFALYDDVNNDYRFFVRNTGNVEIPNDDAKLLFGAGQDASIYYDGTNIKIKPDEVGSGYLDVEKDTGNIVSKFSNSIDSGYAPASILLESTGATARAAGTFMYNTLADDEWYSGVSYNSGFLKYHIGYLSTTSFNTGSANTANAKFTIQSDGNVGIGTDSPIRLTHIYGMPSSTSDPLLLVEDNGTTSGRYIFEMKTAAPSTGMKLTNDNEFWKWIIGSNGEMRFDSNDGVGKLYLTNTGDLKISADNKKLYFGAGDDASIYYDGTDMQFNSQEVGSGNFLFNGGRLLGQNLNTDETNKVWRIGTNHYNISEEPFYYIIGTTLSTSNVLSLGGGTSSGNAATSINFYTANNNIATTGTKKMTIDSDGNIGIGTDDPDVKLHVNSGTHTYGRISTSNTGGNTGFQFENTGDGDEDWSIGRGHAGDFSISNDLVISTAERLIIDTDGNIKIPADDKKLYFGAGDDASIEYNGNNMLINPREVGDGIVIIGDSNFDDTKSASLFVGDDSGNAVTTATSNVGFGENALEKLTIGNNNVAFGYNALNELDDGNRNMAVGGAALGSSVTGDNNAGIGYAALLNAVDNSNTAIGASAGRGLYNGSYNIFIGASAGSAASDINQENVSNSIAIGYESYTTEDNQIVFGNSNTENTIIRAGDFSVDTDTLFVDSEDDRVGIGTDSPSEALDVQGNITLTECIKFSGGGEICG